MFIIHIYCILSHLNKSFIRYICASILAGMGLLCGIVPEVSWQSPGLTFNFSAYTQDFSDTQIRNYAKTVLDLEVSRKQAYEKIQKIINQDPPLITCYEYRKDTNYRNLPPEARKIFADYCATSEQIVEKNGFSSTEFNNITRRVLADRELKRRVQNAMIRIRRQQ